MRLPLVGWVVVVAVLVGCAAAPAGAGGGSTEADRSTRADGSTVVSGSGAGDVDSIDALRTDPDQRGLVAMYTGGSCDGPARLAVTETATQVDIHVTVESQGGGWCDSAGHVRNVAARLAAPLGTRTVTSGPQKLVPFDGSQLQIPASLPAGFRPGLEEGSMSDAGVTTTWSMFYGEPDPRSTGNHCTATRGYLDLQFGPAVSGFGMGQIGPATGWTAAGTATVGTATARLWHQKVGGIAVWAYTLPNVVVTEFSGCDGDRVLTPAELLTVARSLRSG